MSTKTKIASMIDVRASKDEIIEKVKELIEYSATMAKDGIEHNLKSNEDEERKKAIKDCLAWVTYCCLPVALNVIEIDSSEFLLNFIEGFFHNIFKAVKDCDIEQKMFIAKRVHHFTHEELFSDLSKSEMLELAFALFAEGSSSADKIKEAMQAVKETKDTDKKLH